MNRLTACAGALAVLLLAACGPATGTGTAVTRVTGTGAAAVTGRFVLEGGPLRPGGQQPRERLIPGTVTFTAAGGRRVSVRVGRSGTFSAVLPPGTYHVAGRSPIVVTQLADGASVEATCSQPLVVQATGQHILRISVTCIVP
jgi:hypothetical protein